MSPAIESSLIERRILKCEWDVLSPSSKRVAISDNTTHSAICPLLLTLAAIVLQRNVFLQPLAVWIKKRWPWLLVIDSKTVSKAAACSGLNIALCLFTKVAISSTSYCSACKRGLGILWPYYYCWRGIGKNLTRLLPIPTNILFKFQRL